MIDLLRLCRLYYCLPMASILTLTIYYARGGAMMGEWPAALLATAALSAVIAAAYVLNDVIDAAVDRVNAPHRPIAAGRVSRRVALAWFAILLAGGLLAATAAGVRFAAVLSLVAAGAIGYDLRSKSLGAGKPLAVAALMTSIYPLAIALAGWPVGPRAGTLAAFPAWLFLTAFGYEVLKDLRDLAGDRQAAAGTSSLHRRPGAWRGIASAALVAGALLLAPPIWLGCRWVYASMVPAAVALAVVSAWRPVRGAIRLVYAEVVLVGLAATADVLVAGF